MCGFEGICKAFNKGLAWWLSWLERRPVTAEVVGSNPIRVVCMKSLMQHLLPAYVVLFQCMLQKRDLSSAGRASALQAEGHRFEPCRSHFHEKSWYAGVAELADAQDLKSCGPNRPYRFDSGRRHELKAWSSLFQRVSSFFVFGGPCPVIQEFPWYGFHLYKRRRSFTSTSSFVNGILWLLKNPSVDWIVFSITEIFHFLLKSFLKLI